MRQKVQIKFGCWSAGLLEHQNILVSVVSSALGGSSDKASGPPPPRQGYVDTSGSLEQAVANANRALGF